MRGGGVRDCRLRKQRKWARRTLRQTFEGESFQIVSPGGRGWGRRRGGGVCIWTETSRLFLVLGPRSVVAARRRSCVIETQVHDCQSSTTWRTDVRRTYVTRRTAERRMAAGLSCWLAGSTLLSHCSQCSQDALPSGTSTFTAAPFPLNAACVNALSLYRIIVAARGTPLPGPTAERLCNSSEKHVASFLTGVYFPSHQHEI